MRSRANILAAVGLALGAVFGMAGTMISQPSLRAAAWAIDGVGLVAACTLMALDFFSKKREIIAAGFLVFAIGESVMLSGTAAGAIGSVPSFGAGTALWATGLLLISGPKGFPVWVRAFGSAAATLFAITAARIFLGEQLLPTAWLLPSAGYPFLVITFIGWITVLLSDQAV
jgi:hypothetical protein